jgi:hypothetical protein
MVVSDNRDVPRKTHERMSEMTHPTDDELEAMAVKFEQDHWFDAAAMLRACKTGDAPDQGEWNMDESEYGTLIYSLKQDGWRKGEPIMVNDVTIRIENANGSSHDLGPIAARILAALNPAPDNSEWNAAIEAAANVAQLRSKNGSSEDHPYNRGWIRCATITSDAIRALKKGPPR